VAMEKGDEIVLFRRTYDDVTFHASARISEVKRERSESGLIFAARVTELRPLEAPSQLSELTYSLLKVYRFKYPHRHFCRQYVRLPEKDFRTILSGSIYWGRTAFGLYVNGLQREQLARFIQLLADSEPTLLPQSSDFGKAWSALRRFIEEEYFSAAEILKSIHSLVDKFNRDGGVEMNYNKLGISSDDEDTADLLHVQEKLLAQFHELTINVEERVNVLEELSERIREMASSEAKFANVFRGQMWPLQMTNA
jgi:hypothetical protein